MALQRIPTELLRHVVRQLEPDFFRQDLGRLTLCRAWYPLALEVLHSRVFLTERHILALEKAVTDASFELPPWVPEEVRSLSLRVRGLLFCGEGPCRGAGCHMRDVPLSCNTGAPAGDSSQSGDLDRLCRPIQLLAQLRPLRTLRVDVTLEARTEGVDRCEEGEVTVGRAVDTLTRLPLPALRELDVTFATAPGMFGEGDVDPQFCWTLSELLSQMTGLETLHVTLPSVGRDMSEEPPPPGRSALERLHIQVEPDKMGLCRHTDVDADADAVWRAEALGAEAQRFAAAFTRLAVFRITWSNADSESVATMSEALGRTSDRYMYAWDGLKGEARTFRQGEPWDSEGKRIDLEQEYAGWRRKWECVSSELEEYLGEDSHGYGLDDGDIATTGDEAPSGSV